MAAHRLSLPEPTRRKATGSGLDFAGDRSRVVLLEPVVAADEPDREALAGSQRDPVARRVFGGSGRIEAELGGGAVAVQDDGGHGRPTATAMS